MHSKPSVLGLEVPGLTGEMYRPERKSEFGCLGPKLVIVMVGLPARGKSYISQKLCRYLSWLQFKTRVFNAGQTRRTCAPPGDIGHPAEFFDPQNPQAVQCRENIALQTLDNLLDWLQQVNSCVGILDATNSTTNRRKAVMGRVRQRVGPAVEVLFLESCCYDKVILEKNILLKLSGPDYINKIPEASLADFRTRIKLYEKSYEQVGTDNEERHVPYLRLVDVGRQVIANGIRGYLSSQVVEYLLNFRLHERQIWITRNGESEDDAKGIIGRSSCLSSRGTRFAAALQSFIKAQRREWETKYDSKPRAEVMSPDKRDESFTNPNPSGEQRLNFHVWTSMMTQAIETGKSFDERQYKIKYIRMLNDLQAGKMEGLTFPEIESKYSEEMAMRRKQPVFYRWPGSGGESYADVINRLRPIIMELERMEDHVLLITHRAVARVLLAYFQDMNWDDITDIDVPLGRVFSVEVRPYGVAVECYQYDDVKNTFEYTC